ncbi:ABC transporter permease subunit [Streptomyces smyrnaeus]|uniref:ABC transporter permease subunit n=1 Tax=Streptomyces TaxID=1883 RepID=UPI000C17A573|nr:MULTISPECIES: ABC transporter permease subunit [unclassified Streptomyces]MBQ0865182.1 ABC transporter permease subunit [Streptomyces sp. RK75]MBQ1121099.1 ABC transporter permease subunit [Streptomyces sp. B15]MBQ1161689.1 ABC transporter permease subunit [Streptomyces sp. A73]
MSTQQYEGQAAGQANWPNGIAPYNSPIPMARTHLGHALVSEWTKIRTVRSTVWTLSVMFVLVVGIGLLTAMALSGDDYTGMPLLSSGLFGLMLGQLCVITLGVLVVTSEYGTGMIRTTLTACPQRGRVLLAKAVVFFVLAFVMTTLACTLTALINSALLSDQTRPSYVSDSNFGGSFEGGKLVASGGEWLGATVGAGLYVALLGLLSLAVGALLRHSAGAITTMMGVVLLPLVMALFMAGEALKDVRDFLLEYSPLNGLASLYRIPMSEDQDATGWPLLGGLAVVTLIVLGVAYALLHKRDV